MTMKVHSNHAVFFAEEYERCVNVFWLQKEVSQSHEKESNACTLIALQFLRNCVETNLKFRTYVTQDLLHIFKKSIVQGNNIYGDLYNSGLLKEKYLNVPEALNAVTQESQQCLVEWRSFFYDTPIAETLYINLKENLEQWLICKPPDASADVNVVLIANLRAVAFVVTRNPNVVTLVDSHAHCPYGAVIAITPHKCLESICRWYATQLKKDTQPYPVTCYELSFLYHQG